MTMVILGRLAVLLGFAAASMGIAIAGAGLDGATRLFKIVTVRDEIVVGLTAAQQRELDSRDAPGLARALTTRGTIEAWRYAVGRGSGGELINAPAARVGLLVHDTLRVEPYATPLAIAEPREPAE